MPRWGQYSMVYLASWPYILELPVLPRIRVSKRYDTYQRKYIMKNVLCWFADRMKEPSSWASGAVILVGVGALVDQPVVIIVGIIGGALGWVLKERGDF